MPEGTCFVVMGFGKKTDFESGRTLDLDKSYKNLVKPAVEAAGLRCVRADEIVHSGLIDLPMYEQLLAADVVIADISTSNKNAYYELGVRHALRPYSTLVICEDGIKTFPFDVNHVTVRQYHHLGEDIGYSEVERFRRLLTDAITEILARAPAKRTDSPVYTFLPQLSPPGVSARGGATAAAAAALAPGTGEDAGGATYSSLLQQVEEAERRKDLVTAKSLLGAIRSMMKAQSDAQGRPEDAYIVQRLALLTYKSKHPTEEAALREARDLLATLGPSNSNDTETLGLWGAVHKRLWEATQQPAFLDEAVRAYERGFYLRDDYYNGINLAFLLNVRATQATEPAEAVADFVLARRVRRQVLSICDKWLAQPPTSEQDTRYWVLATRGEALFGLEDPTAQPQLEAAYLLAPKDWMKQSTQEQIGKLARLIAQSPLDRLRTGP